MRFLDFLLPKTLKSWSLSLQQFVLTCAATAVSIVASTSGVPAGSRVAIEAVGSAGGAAGAPRACANAALTVAGISGVAVGPGRGSEPQPATTIAATKAISSNAAIECRDARSIIVSNPVRSNGIRYRQARH